jgi:hypothetical protein
LSLKARPISRRITWAMLEMSKCIRNWDVVSIYEERS